MPVDPRLRQRAETVTVRPGLNERLSNAQLLSHFARNLPGKVSQHTIEQYVDCVRDALRYDARNGAETPLSAWTKEMVWEYVHYVEANYCRHFRVQSFANDQVTCRRLVWVGLKDPGEATRAHCTGCPLFEASETSVQGRLNALNRFFKFLARMGVVPANFVRDIVSEYRDDVPTDARREKRRNPTVDEEVLLVNRTTHPRNRAFYATSAKWWLRPNEMFMLDRYASFGIPMPEGVPAPRGFGLGFQANPQLRGFHQGGDLGYVPELKGRLDKRKGNRWFVIDQEVRPILEQYFAWWDRKVHRDAEGRPVTTKLWLNVHGRHLRQDRRTNETLFFRDCERLGLMRQGDRADPLRKWTGHCQRHFGEKLCMMHNVPDTWAKHFRGDAIRDARRHYFVPTPEQIREKYHEWVPMLGFTALASA